MASSEHPQSSPLIKEAPVEIPSVPLPPLPQPPAVDGTNFLRRRSRIDALLVVLILLFAFLVVSFPTINTDFFRHAALGRLLVNGEYHFGVDPFVYTAGDTYFVNHSWLFDLLLYGLYQLPSGEAVVVIFKALLTVALAVVLLCAGHRSGQSLWIPTLCTALAILVVSPRLCYYVQSSCLSFFFLGLTVWLLTAADRGEKRWLWLLPPLFALWVNCDSWFFLGPLAVALYLAGGLLQRNSNPAQQGDLRTLGLVFVVGVAACLINPHHVRALTLPAEFGLNAASDLLDREQEFSPLFLSPLGNNYYKPNSGLSVAGLAYWPLLAVGLASFLVVFKQVSWPRLFVWGGFALMSLYNWRAIPFFAIVAGPLTALNWLDFVAQRLGPEARLATGWRRWALAGRTLTLLLSVVLLIATVPGWLQKSQTFYRIGWSVLVNPSLQQMGEAIHGWRQAGLLPEEPHWFNMNIEVANYLAWFAPGERVFLDYHLLNYRDAAEDYLAIRQGLEQEREPDPSIIRTDWSKIIDERRVRFWIYDNIGGGTANSNALAVLFTRSGEWSLCHLKGRIAIFAKRDPQRPQSDPATRLALDLRSAAFGPNAETAPPRGADPAPPREWWQICWDVWWHPHPPPSSERESLALYDYRYQAVDMQRQIYLHSRAWQAAVAASGISASLPGGPLPAGLLTLSWSCTYHNLFPPGAGGPTRRPFPSEELALQVRANYVNNQFLEPPSLYLAIRAARRALLADPEDGPTYFRLGQTYQYLRALPQELMLRRLSPQAAPPLVDAIRRTQMIAAYQNCLRFAIDDDKAAQAHLTLYRIYNNELNYIDAATHHLRQALDRQTAAGMPLGLSPTAYNQALEQLSAELARLDTELARRMDHYDLNAASKSGLEKVQAALQEGLSETALTLLEQESSKEISSQTVAVVKVMAAVALDVGQLDTAYELLGKPEGQTVRPEELELYLRLTAARGDYAEADRLLDDALRHAWQPPPGQRRAPEASAQVSRDVGRVLLAEALHAMRSPCLPWVPNNLDDILTRPGLGQNPSDFWRRRWRMEATVNALLACQQQGDWELVRGWLALEAGQCVAASRHFQTVRDLAVLGKNWAPEINKLNAWLNEQVEPRNMQQVGLRHAILRDQGTRYLNWLKEEAP